MSNLQIRLLSLTLGMIGGAILGASDNIFGVAIFIICSVLFLFEYYRAQRN